MRTFQIMFAPGRALAFVAVLETLWYGCVHFSRPYWLETSTPTVILDKASFVSISGLLLFTLANHSATLARGRHAMLMLGSAMPSIAVFEYIGSLAYMHNGLTPRTHWGAKATAVYGTAFAASVLSLLPLSREARRRAMLREWLFGLVVVAAVIVASFGYTQITPGTTLHVHHWWYAYVLAFFARFETAFSSILSGVLIGIYVEGMAMSDNLFIIDYQPLALSPP